MMEVLFLSSLILLTGLLFLLNARFVRRNILFSVFVPEKETDNSAIHTIKGQYIKQIIILSFAMTIINAISLLLLKETTGVLLFIVWLHILIIGAIYCYKQAHDHLSIVKKKEDWMKDIKVVKATDTSLMEESSALPNFLFLIQLLAYIVAFIFVALNYNNIPNTIATHWNFQGEADDFSKKSFSSVYGVGGLGLVMLFVLWASSKGTSFLNTTVNPAAKAASLKYIKQSKLINSMMIHILSFTMTIIFILILIRPVIFDSSYLPNGVMLTLLGIIVLVVFACIYLQIAEERKYRHAVAPSYNKAPYYDEANYVMGLFYYNKHDKHLWVPKLSGIGMTLNMARPMAWFVLFMLGGLPIVIIVLITIFS